MQVLRQLSEWLTKGEVQKLIVVITGVETKEVLERWVFNIDTDKVALGSGVTRQKNHKDIQGEIQAIIRQVTACVTFLPLLEEACSFDLLVYADADAKVPSAWEESGALRTWAPVHSFILAQVLPLRSPLPPTAGPPAQIRSTLRAARRCAYARSPRRFTRWHRPSRIRRALAGFNSGAGSSVKVKQNAIT